jgi:hypothetical protein
MIDYYRDVRGLLCRRDDCHREVERFGLCARDLRQVKNKKTRKKQKRMPMEIREP